MIKDLYNQAFNQILQENAKKLLATQYKVFQTSYDNKSGDLAKALSSGSAASAAGGRIELDYPIYIRFLDMKKLKLAYMMHITCCKKFFYYGLARGLFLH